MKSALKPALENVEKALMGLETVLDARLNKAQKTRHEPQLDLSRNEREVNKKIAARLDQTISRLETILSEEE
jgi:hypothetical protein